VRPATAEIRALPALTRTPRPGAAARPAAGAGMAAAAPASHFRSRMTLLDRPATPPLAARLRGVKSSPVREILALTARPGVISFAGGLPAPELFDTAGLRAAFAAALADDVAGRSLQYSTTEGDPLLRARIADRLTVRGLPTRLDELLITSGSQQALTLIATVLLEPGDTVLVEEPSYLAALQAFQLAGAAVVPVPCDDDGLDPDAAAALAERHRPRLLYTIPTFQNPTGRTLALERRAALVALARNAGFWLLEDDPYGELRYSGAGLPALAALDDRVLSLSTLSKIAAPGLRIGWVRTPRALRRQLVVAKQAADLHSSTIDQAAAARWLAAVDLDAHVEGLRAAYGERRDALLDGLAAALPPGSTHNRPDGGMFVWARLPDGWDAEDLLRRALERDVAFVPGYPFFAGEPDRATLRLSFTTHSPAEIADGLARLRGSWH
jgi:2-aminoadipate transaminase